MTQRVPMPKLRKEWTSACDSSLDRLLFAGRLRACRERRGIRQADLARAVGVSAKTINSIEYGHAWPSFPLYVALCRTLGLGHIPLISQ